MRGFPGVVRGDLVLPGWDLWDLWDLESGIGSDRITYWRSGRADGWSWRVRLGQTGTSCGVGGVV